MLKKADYSKIAVKYNDVHGASCSAGYLSQIDKGNLVSTGVLEKIKKIAYHNGKLKKEYLTIDYKELAVQVSKKIGKFVSTSYVKQVHSGAYTSAVVLDAVKELLK